MNNGIDLNTAPEQSRGPIPPDSLVVVRLHLRPAPEGRTGSAPGLTRAQSSSMEYLNCEFEVMAGGFKSGKIWNNYSVAGAQNEGQRKAVDISMRFLRAMVEAARGILPEDQTPQATQQRRLQGWMDLDNIIFPVQVGCEISQPDRNNKRYVNNTIKKIITPDHEAYETLMQGGEVISSNPIPQIGQAQAQGGSPMPPWGAGQNPPAGQPRAAAPGSAARPPWGAPAQSQSQPQGPMPPPGPAFPSEAAHMDDVPF